MKLAGIPVAKLCYSTAFISIAVIAALTAYVLENQSGHTGTNPWLAASVFLPTALLGGYSLITLRRNREPLIPGICALFAGTGGMALLAWLDLSNTLLPYEVWLQRGMP